MAVRYYDDAITYRLKKWIPDDNKLRVLKPDETKRLFELKAEDSGDKPIKLPFVAVSRNNDIELLLNLKNSRSYDGLKLYNDGDATAQLNVIPIRVEYQIDIYTKTYEEGDEYLRNFLFKLINNPTITIEIPYNNSSTQMMLKHVANIRVLETVTDNSAINERLFTGQFTRWTIQLELQDAFLFSVPYKKNWHIDGVMLETLQQMYDKDDIWNEKKNDWGTNRGPHTEDNTEIVFEYPEDYQNG